MNKWTLVCQNPSGQPTVSFDYLGSEPYVSSRVRRVILPFPPLLSKILIFNPLRFSSGSKDPPGLLQCWNMLTFALQKECPENFYESGSRWIEIWLTWHSNKAYESAHLLVHVLLLAKEVFFLLIIICEKNKQILEIWSRVSKCFSFTVSLFSYILGWLSLAVSNWGSTLWCLIEDMLQ